jgi:hypothetical protein
VLACLCAAALRLTAQSPQGAPPTPEQRAHALVDLLAKQDFATVTADFDATMKAALTDDQLRAGWTSTIQQAGAFRRQAGTKLDARGALQIVVVTCEFERSSIDIQVVYNAAGLVAGLSMRPAAVPYTPPAYATAGTYTEEETTVGSGEWVLPGTLTRPAGAGPFPAVVLVHGSGPNDRDETIGPNKPFKDLALGLASRGIAVLRFDKRTRVYGAKLGVISQFTVKEESIDDALLAVARLRATPKIDPARIFVIGHSLGGTLIPRIGLADARLAGLIVMAGAVRSIPQAMLDQTRYLSMADGTISPAEQRQIDAMQKLGDAVKALTPADAASPASMSGAPASYWLDLRGYDPPQIATGLKTPMLILQGERDYQVTMADDFAKWKAALSSKATVTFHSYPALNHLFIAGTGPSLPGEYNVPSHVDGDVIRDIAAWIGKLK